MYRIVSRLESDLVQETSLPCIRPHSPYMAIFLNLDSFHYVCNNDVEEVLHRKDLTSCGLFVEKSRRLCGN